MTTVAPSSFSVTPVASADSSNAPNNKASSADKFVKLLPWEISGGAKFCIETEIKESQLPNGGKGRFSLVSAKRGDIVAAFPLYNMKDFVADHQPGTVNAKETFVIQLKSADDMDLLFEHFMASGRADISKEDVAKMMSWFVGGYPATGTSRNPCDTVSAVIYTHSVKTNHCPEMANMEMLEQLDGTYAFQATKDIEAGDELFLDYKEFRIPSAVKDWMAERNLTDVHTFAVSCDATA